MSYRIRSYLFGILTAILAIIVPHPTAFAVPLETAAPHSTNEGDLLYSTFLGGLGPLTIIDVAVDAAGAAYIAGCTEPVPGDVFIAKLTPNGRNVVYAQFLRGSDHECATGVAVDGLGAAYVTGFTESADFPVQPTSGAPNYGGVQDAFVAKLTPAGDGVVYATLLGGSEYDEGSAIAVDNQGAAFVAGESRSPDFPLTPNAFDTTTDGGDIFVAKLNASGSSLIYSTAVGGVDSNDHAGGIAVDQTGAAYITGETTGPDFPTTPDAYEQRQSSLDDVLVFKLDPTGSILVYSTMLGVREEASGTGIALDDGGNAYVTGYVNGTMDATPGAFDTERGDGDYDAYVVKLNAGGTGLIYATYLGDADARNSYYYGDPAIAVDDTGAAYVAGTTSSEFFPITPWAYDQTLGRGSAFVTKLSPEGRSVNYSTFLGGSDDINYGSTLALAPDGAVYVVGATYASDFPTTPDAFDPSFNPEYGENAFVAKLRLSSTDREPVIFLPGVGGSVLKQTGKAVALWPNVLAPDERLELLVRFMLGEASPGVDIAKQVMELIAGNAQDLKLNGTTDVYATDALRWVVNYGSVRLVDIYGSFLNEYLPAQQYRPYALNQLPGEGCDVAQMAARPDLFVFPYDWRQPIEVTAQRLDNYVTCVRQFYPTMQVNFVAHSMGGLVARRYVLDKLAAGQPHYAHRLITLGTPWLGAPKLQYAMLTGTFTNEVNWALVRPAVLKDLLATFPGVHELNTSSQYFARAANDVANVYPLPFAEKGWDLNNNDQADEEYTYPVFKTVFDRYFEPAAPISINEAFHSQPGQDLWDGDTSGVVYQHILGDSTDTILQVQAKRTCTLKDWVCVWTEFVDHKNSVLRLGDGTTPALSGLGSQSNIGNQTYYYFLADQQQNSNKYSHGELLKAPEVQQCVFDLLSSRPCNTNVRSTDAVDTTKRFSVLIVGVETALAIDASGRISGLVDGAVLLQNIPEVGYFYTGGNAARLDVDSNAPLTIHFKSGVAPLAIEITGSTGGQADLVLRYRDLQVPSNTVFALKLPPTASSLSYDMDGDELAETLYPTAPTIVVGADAADLQPPKVSLKLSASKQQVTIEATHPVGVTGIYYSFDGINFQPYSAPLQVNEDATAVYAFADDALGNRSILTTLSLRNTFMVNLPFVSKVR